MLCSMVIALSFYRTTFLLSVPFISDVAGYGRRFNCIFLTEEHNYIKQVERMERTMTDLQI